MKVESVTLLLHTLARFEMKPPNFHEQHSMLEYSFLHIVLQAHCFTGTKDEAKELIDNGLYIGITGW